MSFSTYADLQSQIANWLARDDLTNYIPDFIRLFECSAARRLKVRPTQTSTTLTPSSGTATLPTDFFGVVRATWTGDPRVELSYAHPTYLEGLFPTVPSGTPSFYTIEGTSLKVRPSDDTAVNLLYNQRTAAVESALNWLYTSHFDAYLFGSLAEANAFNKDVDPAGLWKARRDEVFSEILMADFNERGGMAVRVFGQTP
ncbi:hypothetical protein [Bradyrhizobium sp. LVM 105]|uniref:phage adaptor protein n=1 Tax=Bradyrhizobium sp. LVM 105 TaxID=2341115 RepID=UPI000F80211F|nr:hypothetical protein [Bradyrhizobium sp. LVM 105]RTE91908.1 hypothetical protein D6B98_15955 [Bradyrhizobium sp. LVM 105]